MEPMVLDRWLSPPANCRAQVSRKCVRPRTGATCSGLFAKHLEEEYGYHDTSDNHRCAAVTRRRLVRPRALVLVNLPTISERSSHLAKREPFAQSSEDCACRLCRLQNWKLGRSRQSTRTRPNRLGFDRPAVHSLICMQFRFRLGWVRFNNG
jgi:hypothetical protein